MNEVYRDIADFPGYRVGADGSVWCCRPINGKGSKPGPWRLKKSNTINRHGHQRVDLYRGTDNRHLRYVHRLVLEAFVGPCPPGMEACHNDGNPRNNCLVNLRWDTRKGNAADQAAHGTLLFGEKNPNARITADTVLEIRRLAESGEPRQRLAIRFGVSKQTIWDIIRRRRWAHVA